MIHLRHSAKTLTNGILPNPVKTFPFSSELIQPFNSIHLKKYLRARNCVSGIIPDTGNREVIKQVSQYILQEGGGHLHKPSRHLTSGRNSVVKKKSKVKEIKCGWMRSSNSIVWEDLCHT